MPIQFHPSPRPLPARKQPGQDALRTLVDGLASMHRLRQRLALTRSRDADSDGARQQVVRRLCGEMAVHLHIEDELLYPRLRELLADPAAVDPSKVEHECLRDLMDRLVGTQPDDPLFDARVAVLGRCVEMHFQREMEDLVPLLRGLDLGHVGQDMADRRDELLASLAEGHGLHFENEQADPLGAPPR